MALQDKAVTVLDASEAAGRRPSAGSHLPGTSFSEKHCLTEDLIIPRAISIPSLGQLRRSIASTLNVPC